MNNVNKLFYSQHCPTCRRLLMILKNQNLLCYFQLQCIDHIIDKLPPDMVVPMMVLISHNRPLVGEETFEWVKSIKFMRSQQVMDINKKIIQQNNTNPNRGPIGYDREIMTGISDTFAFTKTDDPLPHSYFGINEEQKHAIFTAPDVNESISNREQSKLIKDLETRRREQDLTTANLIKQEQMSVMERLQQNTFR